MGYIARITFADLQDGRRLYHEGEKFPRDGLTVSEKRLAQLSGSDNLMGYPLIVKTVDAEEKVSEEKVSEEKPVVIRKRGKKDA